MPKIVSQDEWLVERNKHLEHEKGLTKQRNRVNTERRRLPIAKIEKDYAFDGLDRRQGLGDLFQGCRQLIVYHFMFDPKWRKRCSVCTGYVNALGDLSMLRNLDTTFVVVSRAPLRKLETCKGPRDGASVVILL